ncbi:MAG: radical SAM protein [Kiritimatiellae bacterium]|nr:radical SAM protein [Kiritimatiellia bacterium]
MDQSPLECANSVIDSVSFFRKFRKQKVALRGAISLTERCNLRCVHCYVGFPHKASDELSTSEWKRIIDELADEGCLFLLITGGEPLLRPDFCEIYSYARKQGMLTAVFTNGTCVTDEHCQLFSDLPPRYVETTLYGASTETYEKITGVKGAYQRCITGIETLLEAGVDVRLKTMILDINYEEYEHMQAIADSYGIPFRSDGLIFSKLDGCKEPLKHRAKTERIVACEMSDPHKRQRYKEFYDRAKNFKPTDKLYTCGTGQRSFYITSKGILQGCVLAEDIQVDLRKESFHDGWKHELPKLKEIRIQTPTKCTSCYLRPLCGVCPPLALLEKGTASSPCDYLCSLGKSRYDSIMNCNSD